MPSANIRKIVVIGAGTPDSAHRIRTGVTGGLTGGSDIQLIDCVFSIPGSRAVPKEVCGAILELDPSLSRYPEYCSFLDWCLNQVALRDDFRLFVTGGSQGSSALQGSGEYEALLGRLSDTVQDPNGLDVHEIGKRLSDYVGMVEEIVKRAAWRRLRLGTAKFLGLVAVTVQAICFAFGLTAVLWLPVWDPAAMLGPYECLNSYLAVACGIAGFPLFVLLVYTYARYGPGQLGMFRDPRGVFYSAVASLVGPPIILVPSRTHPNFEWIALGWLLGSMVDSIRRTSLRAMRAGLPLGPDKITPVHGRLPEELRQEYTAWLSPWRIPLMPIRHPRVFISYSRSSPWARTVVESLRDKIGGVKTGVFADIAIQTGDNWRRKVNESLSASTVVIAVLDEITVQRDWPASEIESALRGRRIAGMPELIAVLKPGTPIPSDENWKWRPVFRELLRKDLEGPHSIKIMEYDDTVPAALSFQLHSAAYRSSSMVPSFLASLAAWPWSLVKALLLVWSAAGGIAGHVAILVVISYGFGYDPGRWLAARHWSGAVSLAAAAWAGSACRQTLAARFEFIDIRSRGVMSAHRDATIGLVVLLGLLVKYLTLEQILWAILAAYASFVATDEYWVTKGPKREL